MPRRLRSVLVLLLGGAALAFAADRIVSSPRFALPRDFIEYWAAGRVNARGGNPYHPDALLAEQRRADPGRTHAVMMWNPPPALAVYAPLGLLGPRWAALVWAGAQLAAVLVACDLVWRAYCPAHRWLAAGAAVSFAGTWWLVAYGQNTGLMLLGLGGFLHFAKRDRPLAAGACAALTALKPHLLAVFGVLLVADFGTRRGRRALAAGSAALGAALAAALAPNPAVVAQFVEAARHPAEGATPLSAWAVPVPAYWLRARLAPGHFWVQFVPCLLACGALVGARVRAGAAWAWDRALPAAVAASVLAAPYGGWPFDLPLLLVPVLWALARLARAGAWSRAAALVLGQGALTAATLAVPAVLGRPVALDEYGWAAPAALALCLLALPAPQRQGPGLTGPTL
ncbi:MAG: glycosyltransferase family 87 protein, partial [Gemmata sp.]